MVLSRYHDSFNVLRLAVQIAYGYLRFCVRAQPWKASIFPEFRLPLHQSMGVVYWHGHQLRRLVAGVAEHESLISRALIHLLFLGAIDSLSNIRRLLIEGGQHRAGTIVESDIRAVVTDALDCSSCDLHIVHVGLRRDFP